MKPFQSEPQSNDFQTKRFHWPLAELAWWAFLFALLTGVILSFNYRPWGDVFTNVSKITGQIPYGVFIRKIHYYSGQAFLLFIIGHTFEHFFRQTYRHIKSLEWSKLVFLFFLSFPLVFTGFILKGDKEGIQAARIMVNLAEHMPLVGSGLARTLLRPGPDFFLLPYLYHTVILPLVVIFLLGRHRRRLFPKGELGWPLIALLSVLAVFCPLPADIPPHMESALSTGPWFFQGVQLLLRYGSPLWTGMVWPLIPVGLLAVLAFIPLSWMKWMRGLIVLLCLGHLAVLLAAGYLLPRLPG